MKVVTSQGTTLNVSATKTKIWRLVDIMIYGIFGSAEKFVFRFDSPNNEQVYRNCRCGLICKDSDHLNRIWLHDKGYISALQREKHFGIFYVCHRGKWYSIENKGKTTTRTGLVWWNIEIMPLTEEELSGGVIPEIINCEKTKDQCAVCWFD